MFPKHNPAPNRTAVASRTGQPSILSLSQTRDQFWHYRSPARSQGPAPVPGTPRAQTPPARWPSYSSSQSFERRSASEPASESPYPSTSARLQTVTRPIFSPSRGENSSTSSSALSDAAPVGIADPIDTEVTGENILRDLFEDSDSVTESEEDSQEEIVLRRVTRKERPTMAARRIARLDKLYKYDPDDPEDEELTDQEDSVKMDILKMRKERQKEKARDEQTTMLTIAMQGMKTSQGRSFAREAPKFYGKEGESAVAHLFTVDDWRLREGFEEGQLAARFSETLRDEARIWYNDNKELDWAEMQKAFIREFDRDGMSIRELRTKWLKERYDPTKEDIKVYIRRFNLTAQVIDMPQDATVAQLKESMPEEMIAPLFDKTDKVVIEKLLISFYKAKAARMQAAAAAPVTTNPFAHLYSMVPPTGVHYSMGEQNEHLLAGRNKPYKPQVYQPQKKGQKWQKAGKQKQPYEHKGGYGQQQRYGQGNKGRYQKKGRAQGGHEAYKNYGKYDANKQQKYINPKPKQSKVRDSDQDRAKRIDTHRCHHCKEIGHWKRECPILKLQQQLDKQPPYSVSLQNTEALSDKEQLRMLKEQLAFYEANAEEGHEDPFMEPHEHPHQGN